MAHSSEGYKAARCILNAAQSFGKETPSDDPRPVLAATAGTVLLIIAAAMDRVDAEFFLEAVKVGLDIETFHAKTPTN